MISVHVSYFLPSLILTDSGSLLKKYIDIGPIRAPRPNSTKDQPHTRDCPSRLGADISKTKPNRAGDRMVIPNPRKD